MKRILYTLLLLCLVFNGRSQTVPTHEVNGGFNGASYDSDLMEMSHPFATYYYDMYPQWTNHIYSWSRGGSAFPGDYQNQEGKRLLPLFHSFDFPGYNWNLANDNGGLVSNTTASALLDIASLPPTNYNAVAGVATNEGVTMPAITTQPLGRMPHDSPDGDSLAISGNSGSMGAAAFLGVPKVDLWHHMYTPKFVTDQAGARKLWSGIGGSHFSQSGYWAADLFILQDTGAETNVGSFTLNWNAASISATNHVSLSGLSVVGATLSATVHFDRMPPGFDVPDGTITNDARAFAEVYPELGNALNWIVQVTNLPSGNYNIYVDGVLTDTATAAQLAAGRNWFTNYNGPLWAQRKEVLGRKRDQAGVDRVSLVSHGAGSQGTLGVADLVNYESDAGNTTEVYPAAFSGNNYITHMAPFVSQLRQYDVAIWQAAQQTNHTLTITALNPTYTVNSSATNQLTSDAKFRLFVGNSPADNSVQALNPPIFKWVYYNDPWTIGTPNVTLQTFRFQLSTNGFASTYWDITTSNNFYNCLPPITNADGSSWMGTNYWKIVYMGSNATTVISTGAVQTFTLATSPTLWDRSQFADTNYLIQTGIQHPHVFINTNNLAAMRTYLHGNSAMGFSWNTLTNTAKTAIAQSWWNDDSVTNMDVQNIGEKIADVCLAYQVDSNAVWKAANPGQMVSRFATMFVTSNLDQTTPYNYNEVNKFLPLAYDWAYSDMTTAQRSNVLWVMERMALFMVDSDWWYSGTPANTNRLYTDALKIDYESAAKAGHSHPRGDSGVGLYITWAGMGESAVLRDCQTYFLNYCIGQVDPFNGDEGRGYAEQLFRTLHNLSAQLLLATIDSRMTNNPWFINYPKRYCYWEPLNYCELQDQFGDFGMQPIGGKADTYQFNYKYFDMAIMSINPYIYQQHVRNLGIKPVSLTPDFYPLFGEAFLPFYFPTVPSQADWPDTYYYDPVDGWCMSYAYAPNNWNCFTNGVGFVMSARPAGNRNEHGSWHDGAPQIFAYGAQVTCGGIGQYNKHPIFYDGLFVDGIGDCTPNGTNPTADWYSRFTAFTNSTDFTFCRADLSQAFNNWNTNSFAGGGLGNLESAYNQATNRRPYVTSVQRSLIFPHKKYVVLYDTFQTTTNATFAWKWNIMEPTAVVNTNACAFNYTTTNFFNGSNVSVYVQHIVDPATMTLFNGVGTNYAVSNIFTTEDFSTTNTLKFPTAANEPRWNSTVWVYNTVKTKQWHFMSVIFPVKWGDPVPTITRIDDNTVLVQQGSIDDAVTFDPNSTYGGATTLFKVNLDSQTSGGGGSPVTVTHFRAHR